MRFKTRKFNEVGALRWILAALLVAAFLVVMDKVWPADGADRPAGEPRVAFRCVSDPGEPPCPNAFVGMFTSGSMRNSKDVSFNTKTKDLIRDWYDAHPNATETSWWKTDFSSAKCGYEHYHAWATDDCTYVGGDAAMQRWRDMQSDVKRVTVTCAGTAIIVFLTSGNFWGAVGTGGGVCLWTEYRAAYN